MLPEATPFPTASSRSKAPIAEHGPGRRRRWPAPLPVCLPGNNLTSFGDGGDLRRFSSSGRCRRQFTEVCTCPQRRSPGPSHGEDGCSRHCSAESSGFCFARRPTSSSPKGTTSLISSVLYGRALSEAVNAVDNPRTPWPLFSPSLEDFPGRNRCDPNSSTPPPRSGQAPFAILPIGGRPRAGNSISDEFIRPVDGSVEQEPCSCMHEYRPVPAVDRIRLGGRMRTGDRGN